MSDTQQISPGHVCPAKHTSRKWRSEIIFLLEWTNKDYQCNSGRRRTQKLSVILDTISKTPHDSIQPAITRLWPGRRHLWLERAVWVILKECNFLEVFRVNLKIYDTMVFGIFFIWINQYLTF